MEMIPRNVGEPREYKLLHLQDQAYRQISLILDISGNLNVQPKPKPNPNNN